MEVVKGRKRRWRKAGIWVAMIERVMMRSIRRFRVSCRLKCQVFGNWVTDDLFADLMPNVRDDICHIYSMDHARDVILGALCSLMTDHGMWRHLESRHGEAIAIAYHTSDHF